MGIKVSLYYILSFVIQYGLFVLLGNIFIAIPMLIITPLLLIRYLRPHCETEVLTRYKRIFDLSLLLPILLIVCVISTVQVISSALSMILWLFIRVDFMYLGIYLVSIIIFILLTIGVNSGLLKIFTEHECSETRSLLYKLVIAIYATGFIVFIFYFKEVSELVMMPLEQ